MSKRFGNFQFKTKQPTPTKKARLDIEVFSSQQYTSNKSSTSTAVGKTTKTDYNWGDEDDEFIILASQAAETEILSQQIQHTQNFDVTFGKFSREVDASTQKPVKTHPQSNFHDLLQDDDDRVFSEPNFEENYDNIDKHIDEYFNNDFDDFNDIELKQPEFKQEKKDVFKVPEPIQPIKIQPAVNENASTSYKHKIPKQQHFDQEALKNAAKKKDHARDIQVNFLTNQLDTINGKNERLQKDYSEVLEKVQTKDGEVSMLRYELTSVKKLNETLRLEKIRESENMKKEWLEKVKELEKIIKSQQSEMEFKNVEIMNVKSKKLNNSVKILEKERVKVKKNRKRIFKCLDSNIDLQDDTHRIEIHSQIFEISIEDSSKFNNLNKISNFTKSDSILCHYLNDFQAHLSQLQILRFHSDLNDNFVNQIFATSIKSIKEIEKYSNQIEFVKYNDVELNPALEYNFLCENYNKNNLMNADVSVYQKSKLFDVEKAVIQRRIIAAISIICKYSPSFSNKLILEEIADERNRTFVEILAKVLDKISYSKDLYEYFGFITACSKLLNNLGEQCRGNSKTDACLLSLLRVLIYCRPDNSLTLKEVSEFLLKMSSSDKTIEFIDKLCWKCPASCFVANDSHKILQFSRESCLLQIYGSLLEVTSRQYNTLNRVELKYLVEITLNTIAFLRNSFKHPVQWVRQFTESGSKKSTCDCYIRISNSFVVLFHLTIKNWLMCPNNVDLKTMFSITQAGVLLLADIFHLNYRNEILQIGGNSVKSRLRTTYDWIKQHQQDFKFDVVHKNALKSIDLRLIIDEPLKSTEESNEEIDTEKLDQALNDFYL